MLVNTKHLNVGQAGYDLSEKAERKIAEMVFGSVDHVTKGNQPGYDVQAMGLKIEVKFTNSNTIFIETSRYDGTPSGLSVTEADYYLVVHTGYFNKKIGKVKLIKTADLHDLNKSMVCPTKSYEPYLGSPGSRGFVINKELKNDGWVGNINFDVDKNAFDLSRWTYKR